MTKPASVLYLVPATLTALILFAGGVAGALQAVAPSSPDGREKAGKRSRAGLGDFSSAFPGSEGFGSRASGGRGGRVLEITSLEDKVGVAPEGTLRWAFRETGPRIVVFRVAGTIELRGKLHLEEPHITIAGQTAPGDGITIRGYPLIVNTSNVILQGIRVRLGAEILDNSDAFNIQTPSATDIIVDHCSFSWSTDEVVATSDGVQNITIQNSIISEGLECSIHPEGCHSRGLLVRDGSRDFTLLRNLFSHSDFRNPKLVNDDFAGSAATFDFYNNVIYDWGEWAATGGGNSHVNMEGNFFKLGPSTFGYPTHLEMRSTEEVDSYRIWVDGNVGPSCPSGCPGEEFELMLSGTPAEHYSSARNSTPPRNLLSAFDARRTVVAEAGASYRLDNQGQRIQRRDRVDRRLIRQFILGTGGIIDDPSEVGGWPILEPGLAVIDSDHDGMPDFWERINGFDWNDAADGSQNADGDIWTNVEEYLFESNPSVAD